MRVVVVGAGQVGQTVVKSLSQEHECTVIDVDAARLEAMSHAYDVQIARGNGARRETLLEAGIADAGLVLACTSRDEVNLVTAMLARRLSSARTVVRATEADYLSAWRAGDLDVDLLVSTAFETATAVARVLAVPGARHADFFAGGEVLVLGFDVREPAPPFGGRPLGEADLPADSRVVGLVRDGRRVRPAADTVIVPGDWVIVMASPAAARGWSRLFTGQEPADDVAVFGAGGVGTAVARVLLDKGMAVRLIEADARRAGEAAEALEQARVFHATGLDPGFLRRERIGAARAAVCATGDDSRNLHAAVLAKLHGVALTLAVLDNPAAGEVFDAAGVDGTIDPGDETAEKMVWFTRAERTNQIAMLQDDRFEVLDVAVRSGSRFAHRPLDALPARSVVGALIRDGDVLFPDGDAELRPGDRAIVLTEPDRVAAIERDL
jgi:trk system potassium uptake protein